MKDKCKQLLMNPWTVAIGSGLILSTISVINDLINKEQIFNTLFTMLSTICNTFILILNYRIRVWMLLLGIIVMILLFVLYVKYIENTREKSKESEFLQYTKDVILGYKWRWTWEKDFSGKYYIDALCPICSNCETPLVDNFSGYGGRYKCLRCQKGYPKPLPEFENVKMLISDNARREFFHNE